MKEAQPETVHVCVCVCTCVETHRLKISNSKMEMWSLTVRSMVDLRAMASRGEWMGCTSCSVARNSRHGTIALRVGERMGAQSHTVQYITACLVP